MSLRLLPKGPKPVVAVIGGAVSGSEAAAGLVARGADVVVFEQNARPYGKIQDGLPSWHEKLRAQEYARIDANLTKEGVAFVPRTRLGSDFTLEQLVDLGFSAVVLANGAWRDRPLPVPGVDAYVGRGLVYQNPFVQAFNHVEERRGAAPAFEVPPRVVVLGGGLASIDVAKIVNLVLFRAAFAARGIDVSIVELETLGIPDFASKHGLDPASLGVDGATLLYRRRKQDMPLAQASSDDPKAVAKAESARVKVMERVERKYLVKFEGLTSPVATIVSDDRLVGLRCVHNEWVDGRLRVVPDSEHDVHAPLFVSSIGSIPLEIPGVGMKGELYDFESEETGRLRGRERVFGLGNVLTGKGNIRDSRENSVLVTEHIAAAYLGVSVDSEITFRPTPIVNEQTLAAAVERERWADDEARERIAAFVSARQAAVGYTEPYATWVAEEHT